MLAAVSRCAMVAVLRHGYALRAVAAHAQAAEDAAKAVYGEVALPNYMLGQLAQLKVRCSIKWTTSLWVVPTDQTNTS